MKNYSNTISGRNTLTPQTQPVFGRTDMVKNNAGGYGFEVTPQDRLERFLLIGSEGGTYYVDEQKLTKENATKIVEYIKADGPKVVATVVDFAENNRAPKADALLFVLALAASFGDADTKKAAYAGISRACRTSTYLFTFLANVQNLRGWSRGLRNGVGKFYTSKNAEQLSYQLVKYRNRAGFTHKDALRLSHPTASGSKENALLRYGVGKTPAEETGNQLVEAFEKAQTATLTTKQLANLIREYRLTWEMVPNDKLNDKEVLTALLENMPLTALIRNLNRFSYNGLTETNNEIVKKIVYKLIDPENVSRAGIHPVNVINSMMTYASGRGQKSDKTWKPNQNIVDALADTYELALNALVPTGKNILIGVDVSPSMEAAVGGMHLTAMQIANVLGLTLLKSEPNAELVCFDTRIVNPKFGRRSSIDEAINMRAWGSGTDCAQPIAHALANGQKYDAIIILTDNETWAGHGHGIEYLERYRRSVNRDVKVIEVAMVANGYSTMPNDDKNLLRVVGFDASVTEVINKYLE